MEPPTLLPKTYTLEEIIAAIEKWSFEPPTGCLTLTKRTHALELISTLKDRLNKKDL